MNEQPRFRVGDRVRLRTEKWRLRPVASPFGTVVEVTWEDGQVAYKVAWDPVTPFYYETELDRI
jgi:hypothetical protein